MPTPLFYVQLAPLRACLGLASNNQLAELLGVSARTLARYLATQLAPRPICERAAQLREHAPARRVADTPGARRSERARLKRIGDAYAVNGCLSQARSCYAAAGLAPPAAAARIAQQRSGVLDAELARAVVASAQRRAYRREFMRKARAAGKYRDQRKRHDQPRQLTH